MELELPIVLVAALIAMFIAAISAVIYMIVDATLGVKYYQQFRKAMMKEEQEENEKEVDETETEQLEIDFGGGDLQN